MMESIMGRTRGALAGVGLLALRPDRAPEPAPDRAPEPALETLYSEALAEVQQQGMLLRVARSKAQALEQAIFRERSLRIHQRLEEVLAQARDRSPE